MAQYAHYSNPDPEFRRYMEEHPPIHAEKLTDAETVSISRKLCTDVWVPSNHGRFGHLLPAESDYEVIDHKVPVEGGSITVRVTIPSRSESEKFPVLVYFFGGGFFAGNIDMNDYELRVLSNTTRVTTVNVEYRTDPHPVCHNDSYGAVKWVAQNAAMLRGDLKKGFMVMGSSAGSQIAAVVALRARDDPFFSDHPITGQILQVPSLCHPSAYPAQYKDQLLSFQQNAEVPGWLGAENVLCAYRILGGSPTDLDISPLLAPSQAGLPPALVQVAGLDSLRDEGILYAKLLRSEGIAVTLQIYPGVPHSFDMFMPEIEAAKKYVRDTYEGVRWLLEDNQISATIRG